MLCKKIVYNHIFKMNLCMEIEIVLNVDVIVHSC